MRRHSEVTLFDLPDQLVVHILKQIDSLQDIHSFGLACRKARILLETCESRDLWTKFCPRPERHNGRSLKLALSYNKLKSILQSGGMCPKPATFYYRFQPQSRTVGIPKNERYEVDPAIFARNSDCPYPNFLDLLSLGTIPCSYCPYFTLVKTSKKLRKERRLCFVIYSDDTRKCLYETEFLQTSQFRRGRLMRVTLHKPTLDSNESANAVLEEMENLQCILRKVYHLNKERSDILSKISVLHKNVDLVRSLSQTCGIKELCQKKCVGIQNRSTAFLVSVRMNQQEPNPGRVRRVNHLYSACEQIRDIQRYLECKPENLEKLVIHCCTSKEVKQYKRIIQSMLDHAFLLNPKELDEAARDDS